ncbi:MAG: PQQ-binding-like beta-propeller repeat protein [Candidatus Aminicenantes bacterium]|nr:PQQ-binding-like beta-propeller repeat protein [Candidatus Aminicenantes bacterium]
MLSWGGIFLILTICFFSHGTSDDQTLKSRSVLSPRLKPAVKSEQLKETEPTNLEGTLKWKFYTGGNIESSAAVDSDGTIYFCASQNSQYILYALNPDGTKKWDFKTYGESESASPCVGDGRTIYFGSPDGNFYALNSDGSLKWKFKTGDIISSSPAIGFDGTIYFTSKDGNFYALNPDGNLKWKYTLGSRPNSSPSIGPDGTIYIGASSEYKLCAFSPEGIIRWEFVAGGKVQYSPAINSDGTIYVSSKDGNIYALDPEGSVKWRYYLGGSGFIIPYAAHPTIGPEGTLYFGNNYSAYMTTYEYMLHALNPDGSVKWGFDTDDNILCSPAIGSDGTIYFGCYNGQFYALNPDGSLKWTFTTGDKINSSPAIATDGTVYFGTSDGYFYALNSGINGLAQSSWPKYHHDNHNAGSIQTSEYYTPFGELEKPESSIIYYGDEIEVSGWALSFAGILRVEIYINDVYQTDAELEIARDDIFQRFPEYDESDSGFKWVWDIQDIPRGEYVIEAVAFNSLGAQVSLGKKEIVIFKW